jgi:cytochrome c-type biogenesis protein CcmH
VRSLFVVVASVWLALSGQALAAEALPVGDPVVESRVKKLSEELRCLTCMGQSIADSQSGFSDDMRREMREMIAQGKSDAQIMEFMVQRYGDFVLYRPPVKNTTWLLWFGPFLFFVLGMGALIVKLKKRARTFDDAGLTQDDQVRAARLLKESKEN